MKKHLLHLFMLLVALSVSPTISAIADTFTVDGIKYGYNYNEETAWVDDNKYFAGTDVVIPETVEYKSKVYKVIGISSSAFKNCSSLTSVNLPASLESIGKEAFLGCSELYEINFPSSLKTIGEEAFRRTNIRDVVIPENITILEKLVFAECSNLKNVFIPSSVTTVKSEPFARRYGAEKMTVTLKSVLKSDDLYRLTHGLIGDIITNIHNVELSPNGYCKLLRKNPDSVIGVYLYDLSVKIKDYWQYLKGFSFATESNPYWDEEETTEAILSAGEGWQLPTPDANGNHLVEGLGFGESRDLYLTWNKKDETGEEQSCKITFESEIPSAIMMLQSTQATVVVESMNVREDVTCHADARRGFSYNSWDSVNKRVVNVEKEYDGNEMILDGFPPDYEVEIFPYVYYDGRKYKCPRYIIKTKALNPVARIVAVGPTSVEVEGSYDEGDAVISWKGFYDRERAQTFNGNKATITGYIPETDNNIGFKIIASGKEFVSQDMEFTTETLQLTTLAPKCVSSSCAIVATETNISEMETNAGFQWKKYDAPESLKPSEGYAAIYDGMLEGYLKNLQSTSYYNVRPFYKDANDKYYYGEWVTFDPSDFSYFEPTVHTYPVEEVDGTTATMRGYVLGVRTRSPARVSSTGNLVAASRSAGTHPPRA